MSTRRILAATLLVVLVGSFGACGVESDSSPRALAEDQVPDELLAPSTTTSTTVTGDGPTQPRDVWFLSDDMLLASPRQVEVRAGIAGAIEAVLAGPSPQEQEAGLTTSIPAGTELLGVDQSEDSRLLTIDLSDELQLQEGSELRNAVAQLVYTATSFSPNVDEVRFQIDGSVVSVPADEGATASVVTQADYADLDPETAESS